MKNRKRHKIIVTKDSRHAGVEKIRAAISTMKCRGVKQLAFFTRILCKSCSNQRHCTRIAAVRFTVFAYASMRAAPNAPMYSLRTATTPTRQWLYSFSCNCCQFPTFIFAALTLLRLTTRYPLSLTTYFVLPPFCFLFCPPCLLANELANWHCTALLSFTAKFRQCGNNNKDNNHNCDTKWMRTIS